GLSQICLGLRESRFRCQHPRLILILLNLEKELPFLYLSSLGKQDLLEHALGSRADLNSLAGRSLAHELAVDGDRPLSNLGNYDSRRLRSCGRCRELRSFLPPT